MTDTTAVNAAEGWQTVDLTSSVDVDQGDKIWLAWVFETNPGIPCKDEGTTSTGRAASDEGWAYGMPSDFGSSTTSTWLYAVHAVYTPAAQSIELIGNPYMFTGRRFDLKN